MRQTRTAGKTRELRRNLLAALFVASLAAPAVAAERGPAAERRAGRAGGWWEGARQGLAFVLAGWLGPVGRWTAVWGEDGHYIDPNGLQVAEPPTGASTASIATPQPEGPTSNPNG